MGEAINHLGTLVEAPPSQPIGALWVHFDPMRRGAKNLSHDLAKVYGRKNGGGGEESQKNGTSDTLGTPADTEGQSWNFTLNSNKSGVSPSSDPDIGGQPKTPKDMLRPNSCTESCTTSLGSVEAFQRPELTQLISLWARHP